MGPWTPAEVASLNILNIALGVATVGLLLAVAAAISRDLLVRRQR